MPYGYELKSGLGQCCLDGLQEAEGLEPLSEFVESLSLCSSNMHHWIPRPLTVSQILNPVINPNLEPYTLYHTL